MHDGVKLAVAAVATELSGQGSGQGGDTIVTADLQQCWTISALQNVCFESQEERQSISFSLTTTFSLILGVSG